MAEENPFDDAEANPFADPSVQAASAAQQPEVYNPFDAPAQSAYGSYHPPDPEAPDGDLDEPPKQKKKKKKKSSDVNWPDQEEKLLPAAGITGMSDSDVAVREANLKRREQALLEKERMLEERERLARKQGMMPNNWPCQCYPLLYHSIKDEIQPEDRPLMRRLYLVCLATWLGLFWNWVTVFGRWFTKDAGGSGSQALWSSVYLVMGLPGAWLLWYRAIYYGVRDGSSTKWVVFFFHFLAHIVFCLIIAVGIPGVAGMGLIVMMDLFIDEHAVLGIFSAVVTILFTIISLSSIFLYRRAFKTWKQRDGEKKLKQDAARAAVEHA